MDINTTIEISVFVNLICICEFGTLFNNLISILRDESDPIMKIRVRVMKISPMASKIFLFSFLVVISSFILFYLKIRREENISKKTLLKLRIRKKWQEISSSSSPQ